MPVSRQEDLFSSVDIRYNESGRFFDLTFRGGVTLEILNNSFIRLIEHPQFFYNVNACYNYSKAYPEIEMPGIEEHAHFVSKHLGMRGQSYKLAMIAEDTLNIALLSVYKLLISKTPVEAEVFARKTKAVRWLMEGE